VLSKNRCAPGRGATSNRVATLSARSNSCQGMPGLPWRAWVTTKMRKSDDGVSRSGTPLCRSWWNIRRKPRVGAVPGLSWAPHWATRRPRRRCPHVERPADPARFDGGKTCILGASRATDPGPCI